MARFLLRPSTPFGAAFRAGTPRGSTQRRSTRRAGTAHADAGENTSKLPGPGRLGAGRHLLAMCVLTLCVLTSSLGCATMGLRSAVNMKMHVEAGAAPASALVYVDGTYIGMLGYVAKHEVRLVEGKHRISVEKNGYYPFDIVVESDRKPIDVHVEMLRLPD